MKIIVKNKGQEQRYRADSFPCKIGRSKPCEVVIVDGSVSSHHATLKQQSDGRILIEDNQSTNGVYRGQERVRRVVLAKQTDLMLGNVPVRFELEGEELEGQGNDKTTPIEHADAAARRSCYFRRGDREFGPLPLDELRAKIRRGEVRETDLVWLDGSSSWVKASLLPNLLKAESEDRADEKVKAPISSPPPPSKSDKNTASSASPSQPAAVERSAPKPSSEVPAASPSSPAVSTSGAVKPVSAATASSRGEITCPHCWHSFNVEEFLYIARHQSLVGDPVLGPEAPQRFLPSKFTPEGNAIDSAGMSCPEMACPRCHLRIPQGASEQPPLFLSIVGAAASGKSFFLTSMIWMLRNKLSRNFAISFTDTDAINNQMINEDEELLYLNSSPDELVALRKTELQGELYNQVLLDGMLINLPKPFMFTITPAEHHPHYDEVRNRMFRTLVLYDNAGEHFEPGMDSVDNPTTRHLLHSDALFFLFDPTQDVRFRQRLNAEDPQLAKGSRVQRQEILLTEMINRIKKYSGLRAGSKTAKTLILLVAKADVWKHLLSFDLPDEPWEWDSRSNTCALDVNMVKNVSFATRTLLEEVCPEIVATAETFAGDVLYLPNSAIGRSPELNEESGMLGVRPQDMSPIWVSVPLLYFFYERGLIPALPPAHIKQHIPEAVPIECKTSGDVVFVTLPDRKQPLQVPVFYMGARLRDPVSGVWFDMPTKRNARRTGSRAKTKEKE